MDISVHGYEPVPTLDPMAPVKLLKFMSCNCHGAAVKRMGSSASLPVESVKVLHAETTVMALLSLKKAWTMTLETSDTVNKK